MITLVAGQKGGVGKSTVAMNIAAYHAAQGKDVVLVDADRQATGAKWIARRRQKELPQIACIQREGDLFDDLEDWKGRYAEIVIDSPSDGINIAPETRSAMLIADVMISPFLASQPDVETAIDVASVVRDAIRMGNRRLRAFALLSKVPTNPNIDEEKEARAFWALESKKEALGPLPLLLAKLSERKPFRDACNEGYGIVDMAKSKAKEEFFQVLEEIYSVEISRCRAA